ncbi:MAG: transposase, partial [Betaproteobacteria bacterium]|nr:transposase [Betaproteobacteria bacterium]
MPRAACVQLPGVALHLTQRGRAGAACFSGARDRIAYLDLLRDEAKRLDCTVHAYVLMGNHVHLLLTPAQAGAATLLLRALGERHARDGDERPAAG